MLQVKEMDGSLLIPPFDAKLKLLYKNKHTGQEEIARIGQGPKKNHYYAYFKDDDVDFEIEMNNNLCKDRYVRFGMEKLNEKHGFVVRPEITRKIKSLKTFESNGKKLHFISQSREEEKSLVSSTASTHEISRQDASTLLSQIKFEVYYQVRKFAIMLKNEEDKGKSLAVNSQTTIKGLRFKLALELNQPPENFILILNGKELEHYNDESTLNELKINENSQLTYKRIFIPFEVKIQGEKNFASFLVSSWDPVCDLKKKIQDKLDVPITQQKLLFNEKELYFDLATLGGYLITPNSLLELKVLELFPLKIKMIPSNKIITIPVFSRNKISDVMDKIKETEGNSSQKNQTLFLHGHSLSMTNQLLQDYGIENADAATMFLVTEKFPHECSPENSFPIIVQNQIDYTTINLNVCSSELVREVKEKIQRKTGIPIQDQKLRRYTSFGKLLQLWDDFHLELYEIKENSELLLILPTRTKTVMFVKTLTETTLTIPTFLSETIRDLKCRIQEQEGIPVHQQRLIFNELELEDFCTLSDYNIPKESILHVELQLMGGACGCQKLSCRTCGPYLSERGAITFAAKSNQTFSSCTFDADESIKIEPFIVELRLAGVPLLP